MTLLVTPAQAAKLDLGQNKGTLHLSLRNIDDALSDKTASATMHELRFHQEKPWDERTKGVFAAVGKALSENRKSSPSPPSRRQGVRGAQQVHVRTIRGVHEGRIVVEYPETASSLR